MFVCSLIFSVPDHRQDREFTQRWRKGKNQSDDVKRNSQKREPKDAIEREVLGRWRGYRGRGELKTIVGSACYAYSHFDMDCEWRFLLADHIRTEAGHGWGYDKPTHSIPVG